MNFKSMMIAIVMALLTASGVAFAGDRVDINKASAAELQALKGIGAKTAQAIVEYRNAHGAFKSVDDLKHVKGIGEKKLSRIEDEVKVSDSEDGKKDHDEHDDHEDKDHEKHHGDDD